MSDDKRYTMRDMVLAQREAFENGITAVWSRFGFDDHAYTTGWEGSEVLAKRRYPLPKVTRPRVVNDPHEQFEQAWMVIDGIIGWLPHDGARTHWKSLTPCAKSRLHGEPTSIEHVTNERIALWADLLANPTEEVEAE